MASRFVPTLAQLTAASEQLPDPERFPDDQYLVPIGRAGSTRVLTFRRVTYTERDSAPAARWIFEGKIILPEVPKTTDATPKRTRKAKAKAETAAST